MANDILPTKTRLSSIFGKRDNTYNLCEMDHIYFLPPPSVLGKGIWFSSPLTLILDTLHFNEQIHFLEFLLSMDNNKKPQFLKDKLLRVDSLICDIVWKERNSS